MEGGVRHSEIPGGFLELARVLVVFLVAENRLEAGGKNGSGLRWAHEDLGRSFPGLNGKGKCRLLYTYHYENSKKQLHDRTRLSFAR